MGDTPVASELTDATLASDSELVARARQGDRRSFGTLYLRHHDAAWRIACAAASSNADAEDAVAEGFAKVFAALPRMVTRELAFRPYLLACVRNAAVDRHRRVKRIDLRHDVPEQESPGSDPDEVVLADLDRNLVGEALRSLPERWRTVLWLTEVEGMTPTEAASVIGIKPNAVAALSYRAREGLREAYLQAHVRAEAPAECRSTVDRLSAYVRGELAERERVRVQAHLDGCASCRRRRDELADVNATLIGSLAPVPLLLGSRTQQEWLSAPHLARGARRSRPPAKAARAAQRETSATVQKTLALVVALLLAISGGVAVRRSGPGGPLGKTFDPVAIPKHPSAPAPPGVGSEPTEVAAPAAAGEVPGSRTPPATSPTRRSSRSPLEVAAPAPAPGRGAGPARASAESPSPSPSPSPPPSGPGTPPEQPPRPPPSPETPPPAGARASVGQGDMGAVVALAAPKDQSDPRPDADVTVGRNQVVGDAPPSDGTGADVTPPSQQTASQQTARAGTSPGSFHTASARAAVFPGLQPEIESFGSSGSPGLPGG